jgi:hypothetical protein
VIERDGLKRDAETEKARADRNDRAANDLGSRIPELVGESAQWRRKFEAEKARADNYADAFARAGDGMQIQARIIRDLNRKLADLEARQVSTFENLATGCIAAVQTRVEGDPRRMVSFISNELGLWGLAADGTAWFRHGRLNPNRARVDSDDPAWWGWVQVEPLPPIVDSAKEYVPNIEHPPGSHRWDIRSRACTRCGALAAEWISGTCPESPLPPVEPEINIGAEDCAAPVEAACESAPFRPRRWIGNDLYSSLRADVSQFGVVVPGHSDKPCPVCNFWAASHGDLCGKCFAELGDSK